MASKDAKSKTLGEQITDTTNATREYIAGALSPEATSKTDTSAPPTGPTVGSKLGDAWQSVKEATGLAGDKAQEHAEVTKAQAGNTADHAVTKADNAEADLEQKRGEINATLADKKAEARVQASAAGENAAKAAEDVKHTTATKAQTAADTASGLLNDARKNVANKVDPDTHTAR